MIDVTKKICRQIAIYFSRKCNLACSYCIVPEFHVKEKNLSTRQWLHALDIVQEKIDPEFVVLFGGEPLIYPDIEILVDRVNDLGFAYTLISNGTLDKESVIRKLKGFTISIDRVQKMPGRVSRHNMKDEEAKSGWDLLEKYQDVVPDLVANITVTKENLNSGELELIVDKLNDMGIWIIFSWLMWDGRPEEDKFRAYCPELAVTSDEELSCFEKIFFKAKKRHNTFHYIEMIKKHAKGLTWRYEMDLKQPQYALLNEDGRFMADPDRWGEINKYSIFDMATGELTLKQWWEIVRRDRSHRDTPGNLWNHEIELSYPQLGQESIRHLDSVGIVPKSY